MVIENIFYYLLIFDCNSSISSQNVRGGQNKKFWSTPVTSREYCQRVDAADNNLIKNNVCVCVCVCVWCGVVWCGVVWCGVVWCGVVWCGICVTNTIAIYECV